MLSRRRRNTKKPPRPPRKRDHKKEEKKKEKAKAVVTVERQEHTLQAETAQHTDNNVSSVVSTIIMHHVAEWVPKPKRDITTPREGKPDGGASANVMNEY